MEYINILRFERWRKINDSVLDRNSFDYDTLDKRVIASLKPILTKDGFLKQKIVGGKHLPERKSDDVEVIVMCLRG